MGTCSWWNALSQLRTNLNFAILTQWQVILKPGKTSLLSWFMIRSDWDILWHGAENMSLHPGIRYDMIEIYQNICSKQLPTDSISIPKHHFADQSLLTAFKANCCCFGQHRFVHWVCKGQVLQTAHEVRAGKTLTCSAWIYLDTLHPLLHFVLRIWPLHYSYYTAHNNRYLFDVHTLVSFMLFARNYRVPQATAFLLCDP